MELDNREIAFLIFISLIFGLLLWKAKLGPHLAGILGPIFKRPILSVLGLATLHVGGCVWVLYTLGCWRWDNLKTTLVWFVGSAFVAIINYQKVASGGAYFRSTLVDSIGLAAAISFITSAHTFGLITELAIVFVTAALGIAVAFSEQDAKLRPVYRIGMTLLALLSVLMLGNAVHHIAIHFNEFATAKTIRDFSAPILLTAMFLPFLYGLYLSTVYDRVLHNFAFSVQDPTLRSYTRRKLISSFGTDTVGLEKWRRHTALFNPQSEAEVDSSIAEIKHARRRERQPFRVQPMRGWLPHRAIRFLSSVPLHTNDYHRVHDGWRASSAYLEIGGPLLPNNVAYYVEGDEFVASRLKLVLNINAPGEAEEAYKRFKQIVAVLSAEAIPGLRLSEEDFEIQANGSPVTINGYTLTLKQRNWESGVPGGHDLAFTIDIAELEATAPCPASQIEESQGFVATLQDQMRSREESPD